MSLQVSSILIASRLLRKAFKTIKHLTHRCFMGEEGEYRHVWVEIRPGAVEVSMWERRTRLFRWAIRTLLGTGLIR